MEKLSVAPGAACTRRVEPEMWISAVATVNEREAGVRSTFPAASLART